MLYAIWSFEHEGWWRPDRFGYTGHKEEAGLYLEDEAIDIVRAANMGGDICECLIPEDLLKRDDIHSLFGIEKER